MPEAAVRSLSNRSPRAGGPSVGLPIRRAPCVREDRLTVHHVEATAADQRHPGVGDRIRPVAEEHPPPT